MQKRLWVFPLTVLLAASMQAAIAEDEWEENNTKGVALLQDGKYQDAEKLLLAARKESEKSGAKYGHYATTLLNLGQLYDKMDRVPDSGESPTKRPLPSTKSLMVQPRQRTAKLSRDWPKPAAITANILKPCPFTNAPSRSGMC